MSFDQIMSLGFFASIVLVMLSVAMLIVCVVVSSITNTDEETMRFLTRVAIWMLFIGLLLFVGTGLFGQLEPLDVRQHMIDLPDR